MAALVTEQQHQLLTEIPHYSVMKDSAPSLLLAVFVMLLPWGRRSPGEENAQTDDRDTRLKQLGRYKTVTETFQQERTMEKKRFLLLFTKLSIACKTQLVTKHNCNILSILYYKQKTAIKIIISATKKNCLTLGKEFGRDAFCHSLRCADTTAKC